MATTAPLNKYFSVVVLWVSPGKIPPKGPAIQCGRKFVWVVGERMLGRSAAITTTSTLQAMMTVSATAPASVPLRA
jgi:hypothetical protein